MWSLARNDLGATDQRERDGERERGRGRGRERGRGGGREGEREMERERERDRDHCAARTVVCDEFRTGPKPPDPSSSLQVQTIPKLRERDLY